MKLIPIVQGKWFAKVSDEDYEAISKFKWSLMGGTSNKYYAARISKDRDGKRMNIQMSRSILGLDKWKVGGLEADHIDGDPLNNQRSNLRAVDHKTNMYNKKMDTHGQASEYRGVSPHYSKFRAGITKDGFKRDLGLFDTEVEAALAYDIFARILFGKVVHLNFPELVTGHAVDGDGRAAGD